MGIVLEMRIGWFTLVSFEGLVSDLPVHLLLLLACEVGQSHSLCIGDCDGILRCVVLCTRLASGMGCRDAATSGWGARLTGRGPLCVQGAWSSCNANGGPISVYVHVFVYVLVCLVNMRRTRSLFYSYRESVFSRDLPMLSSNFVFAEGEILLG